MSEVKLDGTSIYRKIEKIYKTWIKVSYLQIIFKATFQYNFKLKFFIIYI